MVLYPISEHICRRLIIEALEMIRFPCTPDFCFSAKRTLDSSSIINSHKRIGCFNNETITWKPFPVKSQ
jgi:hypothetical protein